MTREKHIQAFLGGTEWASARRTPLSQDASFRRYWRLEQAHKSALLMDAPPPEKPVSLFSDIAHFLRSNALHAPEIYALNEVDGLMLIEDFGDETFTRILAVEPASETRLYELAIDTLSTLHQINSYDDLPLATYDSVTLIAEARLFTEWFFPAITGHPVSASQSRQFEEAWRQSINQLPPHPDVLVLRDYHVDNLMRVASDENPVCGVLDFQDALIGSPAYDLISLLEDARRDISPVLKCYCLGRYFRNMSIANNGGPEPSILIPWLNVLGAQRHAKVLGIFVRLYQRDHKSIYLQHLPRVLALYEAAVGREDNLDPIAGWMQTHMPFDSINLEELTSISA